MSVFSASSLSASDASFTRRVKPLPKRRRTSVDGSDGDDNHNSYASPSYYHPIHSGRVNRLKQESNVTPQLSSTAKLPSLPVRFRTVDDADGEGDYPDHLQQPNNTKKRKVPAAAVVSTPHKGSLTLGNQNKPEDNQNYYPHINLSSSTEGARVDVTLDALPSNASSFFLSKQKKRSPVTSATLRLKELLAARRKTLAAVIDNGTDPLVLEFALSSSFTSLASSHLSRSRSRYSRLHRRSRNTTPTSFRGNWSSGPFTFSCVNPTSTKYTLVKKAAVNLQLRFKTELARQTTSAAEIALKHASKSSTGPNTGQRKKLESPAIKSSSSLVPPYPEKTRPPTQSNKAKKKKRSALANASNPHHLRNYVPSRMPQSNGHPPPASAYGQSSSAVLGPLPLKFLSATLPSRRKGRLAGSESISPSLVRPENEWICPFCEYSLFYGDNGAMHRAVKSRKKMLRRRQKARERAAATASGTAAPANQDVSEDEESEGDEDSLDDDRDVASIRVASQKSRAGIHQNDPGPHPGG